MPADAYPWTPAFCPITGRSLDLCVLPEGQELVAFTERGGPRWRWARRRVRPGRTERDVVDSGQEDTPEAARAAAEASHAAWVGRRSLPIPPAPAILSDGPVGAALPPVEVADAG